MNKVDVNQLSESWIAEWEIDDRDITSPGTPTSSDVIFDLTFDEDHEALWSFVLAAYPKEMSGRVFAVLAAGPLEDLLAKFGPLYIDRIEALARQDRRFNDLLGGVWKNSMTDEVWERVTKARNTIW